MTSPPTAVTQDDLIYTVGGTVQPDAGVYIARKADDDLLQACRDGDYAYVLTARQLGKSSLMVRTARRLEADGVRSVIIDLNELGVQTTVQEWYLGLMFRIMTRLKLKVNLLQWWRDHEDVGVTQRLSLFFQEIVLRENDDRVVIFIDEIDTTLSLDFTDDFFAAIRYLYNARSTEPSLKRLSFVLIGVATPSDLIDDAKRTPFNIGRRVDLTDFTRSEAQPLAVGLPGDPSEQTKLLDSVIKWTSGHPYLTQRLCAEIVIQTDPFVPSVDGVVGDIFLGDNAYKDNNLQFVRDMLTKRAPAGLDRELLTLYQQVRLGRSRVRDDAQSLLKSHLKLSGVVKRDGDDLKLRNRIYARAFNRQWVRNQWPVSWFELIPFEVKLAALASLLMLIGLLVATVFALGQRRVAQTTADNLAAEVELRAAAESDALAQAELAEQNAVLAAEREQEALANFELATEREAEAIANAELAAAREVEARDNALLAEQNAALAVAQANLAQSRALANEARLVVEENAQLGLLLAVDSAEIRDTSEARQAIQSTLAEPDRIELLHELPVGNWTSPHAAADWDPSSRYLLVVNGSDAVVKLWDSETGQLYRELAHPGFVSAAFWHPDGQRIVSSSIDGVRIWDVESGSETAFYALGPTIYTNWAQDGATIVTAGFGDNVVRLLDGENGEELFNFTASEDVQQASVSNAATPQLLVRGSQRVFVYDLAGNLQLSLDPPGENRDGFSWFAQWNAAGDLILTHNAWRSDDTVGPVLVWDAATGEQLHNLQHITTRAIDSLAIDAVPITTARWSENGELVYTSGTDSRLLVWDARNGELVDEQDTGSEDNQTVQGNLLLSGIPFSGFDSDFNALERGGFTLRALPSGELLNVVESPRQVRGLAWSPNGRRVATLDLNGMAMVWQLAQDDLQTLLQTDAVIETIVWSHDEGKVLVETAAQGAFVVGTETRVIEVALTVPEGIALSAWSEDDSRILIARRDGTLTIHDAATGEVRQRFAHDLPLFYADWRKDDAQIVTTDQSGTVRLWDVATGQTVFESATGSGILAQWDVAQSRLLVGGLVQTQLFDAQTGDLLTVLPTEEATFFAYFADKAQGHSQTVTVSSAGYNFPFVGDTGAGEEQTLGSADLSALQLAASETTVAGWSFDNPSEPTWTATYDGVVSALPNTDDTRLVIYVWAQAVALGKPPLVEVRDMLTGELLFSGEHPSGAESALWLDEAGTRFVTRGADGKLRIWSLEQPNQPVVLAAADAAISDFDASEDGRELLIGTVDGTVLQAFVDSAELVTRTCTVAYRNLLWSEWQQFHPNQPYRATCPNLPAHASFIDRVENEQSVADVVAFFAASEQAVGVYSAETYNRVCWRGSLLGYADQLTGVCENAVNQADTPSAIGNHRDSRGLQRALTGDLAGAAEDLRAFVAFASEQRDELQAIFDAADATVQQSEDGQAVQANIRFFDMAIAARTAWAERLENGENPYDAAVLEQLIMEGDS